MTLCSVTNVPLSTPNSACNTRLFWPLVVQTNSQCEAKKLDAERFLQALDSTFIIGSTLLNQESYKRFHLAQRVLHASSIFATTTLPRGVSALSADRFARYLTLDGEEDTKNLDYLQVHHPQFSDGFALAFAEYTQIFVLQYYGSFHGGSGTLGADEDTCEILMDSASDVETPACQLTFEQTLSSVFPLTDAATSSQVGRKSEINKGSVACSLLFLLARQIAQTSALTPPQEKPQQFGRRFSIQRAQQAV
jgi:hypothetical protein